MVSQENEKLSIAERAVLLAGLILLMGFTILPKANQAARHIAQGFVTTFAPVPKKTISTEPATKSREGLIVPRRRNKAATAARRDTIVRFTSVLFKQSNADIANADMSAMDDKGTKYHLIVADNNLISLEINDVKIMDNQLPAYAYLVRQIDRELAMKKKVRQEDIAGYKANSPAARFKNSKPSSDQPSLKKEKVNGEPEPKFMTAGTKPFKKHHEDSDIAADRQRARGVVAALISEKVIAGPAELEWFGLSDSELVVNGQKQPERLHQKLKEQYAIKPLYGLYYGPVKMTGTGVFLDKGDL